MHGGLTVVHGGGNAPLTVSGPMDVGAHTITRQDALNWAHFGFAIGQELLVNRSPAGTITGVSGATLTLSGPAMTPATGVSETVAVFGPSVVNTSALTFAGSAIVRSDLRAWAEFGFVPGQQVTIDGVLVGTATLINAYTMYVSALGSWSAGTHTAAIFDASAKPVLMGGDQITITLPDGSATNITFTGLNLFVGEGLAVVQKIIDNPNGYYYNLHTTLNPGGAIRAQLVKQ